MIDLFNRKKIKKLEKEIKLLWVVIDKMDKNFDRPRCFKFGEDIPKYSYLEYLMSAIGAIEKYFGIKIEWSMEDDPTYRPPKPDKVEVWQVRKIKKLKK